MTVGEATGDAGSEGRVSEDDRHEVGTLAKTFHPVSSTLSWSAQAVTKDERVFPTRRKSRVTLRPAELALADTASTWCASAIEPPYRGFFWC